MQTEKSEMKNKRAIVVNGNKNYPKATVFAIRGARIVKSWNVDEYLKLSLGEIKRQTEETRHITSQRYIR